MNDIALLFVLGIFSGLFDRSTFEKMEIHDSKNWLHMPKEAHMPTPDIFLSPEKPVAR